MDWASLQDVWAWSTRWTGPPALVTSIWAFVQQFHKMRETSTKIKKMELETKSIKEKLTPEILKILAEAGKFEAEIEKLKAETTKLQASAIADLIVANKAQLHIERIVECLDEVSKRADTIYDEAEKAYGIFLQIPSREQVKAAFPEIQNFIRGRAERGPLETANEELKILLERLRYSIANALVGSIEEFLGTVSLSSQMLHRPGSGLSATFAEMIAGDDYEPTEDKIETVRNWLNSVRASHKNLRQVLGEAAAQVELRSTEER